MTAALSITADLMKLERLAFIEAHRHLDLTEDKDAWGQPKFMHSHVDAIWAGWLTRASQGRATVAQASRESDREIRTGAHLLQMAKSLGWPDDGEGALEFMLRRAREVAFEDCDKTTSPLPSAERETTKTRAKAPRIESVSCVHAAIIGLDGMWHCQKCGDAIDMAVAHPSTGLGTGAGS